jgi:tight adherence protein B
LPAAALLNTTAPAPPARETDDRLARLTGAAARLAEQTGAPLAELVERIEADARAMDRARAAAAAQAAGARATGYLLAGLPIGGIALGYGIGVDPLDVLLHTPIGAACAFGAVVLQLAGLAWTERLVGAPERAGPVRAPTGPRSGSTFTRTGARRTPDRDSGRGTATRTGRGDPSGPVL